MPCLPLAKSTSAMKTLSIDLRQRIVRAYQNKEGSIRQLAKRFAVSKSSVERLLKAERTTGSVAPKAHRAGREPIVRLEDKALIKSLLEQNCDLTQEQTAERFTAETGRPVSQQTISRALKRLSITRKKSP